MAEFKMPKFVFKDKPISLDECYRELAEMNYKSPVNIINQGFQTKLEGDIYEAILSYGVDVDKDELIKALKYDRNQYEKGYIDGRKGKQGTIRREIAREIFKEIEKEVFYMATDYDEEFEVIAYEDIAELKKKYTEEKKDG